MYWLVLIASYFLSLLLSCPVTGRGIAACLPIRRISTWELGWMFHQNKAHLPKQCGALPTFWLFQTTQSLGKSVHVGCCRLFGQRMSNNVNMMPAASSLTDSGEYLHEIVVRIWSLFGDTFWKNLHHASAAATRPCRLLSCFAAFVCLSIVWKNIPAELHCPTTFSEALRKSSAQCKVVLWSIMLPICFGTSLSAWDCEVQQPPALRLRNITKHLVNADSSCICLNFFPPASERVMYLLHFIAFYWC